MKILNKQKLTFMIFSMIIIIYSCFNTSISCGYREYIKSCIEDGGSFSHAGTPYVVDGQITQDGIAACKAEGVSDAEIASWGVNISNTENTQSNIQTDNTEKITSSSQTKDQATSSKEVIENKEKSPSYTSEEIAAAWVETNRIESTCTETGHVSYTNSLTGETKSEELPLAEHKYAETERTEALCTEAGAITYACEVCGDTYTEEIPALGHEYEWVTTKEAALFTPGEEQYVCKNCGDISETREIAAKCPIDIVIILGLIVLGVAGITFIAIKRKKNS